MASSNSTITLTVYSYAVVDRQEQIAKQFDDTNNIIVTGKR
jgi:hypothetical protein